ncbi:hypothetical protein F5X99DRAFT_136683 [Biscogniauxia marginata]|nr:hypothetical protein F5X99DRAFT_136683 [Biscogniauxia marginata]
MLPSPFLAIIRFRPFIKDDILSDSYVSARTLFLVSLTAFHQSLPQERTSLVHNHSNMASPLPNSRVLITGVTGYIGFHVLLGALRAGWAVRATSRSQDKLDALASHPVVRATGPAVALLELVKAPAFDEEAELLEFYKGVLRGVTHIIHAAAPLGHPELDSDSQILRPLIASIKGLIPAIEATDPPIRRLIVTSSIMANLDGYPPDPTTRVTPETRTELPSAEALAAPNKRSIRAYQLGKRIILDIVDDFARRSRTTDVVNIFPGYVHGGNDGATNLQELDASILFYMRLILTGVSLPAPRVNCAIHIKDTTAVHLAALDETKVPRTLGKSANLGVTIPVDHNDSWAIVEKHFPDAVAAGIFTRGSEQMMMCRWDATETEKRLGMKFRSYEEMVVDFAKQYLELLAQSQSGKSTS